MMRFSVVLLAVGCGPHYWGRRPLDQPIAIDPHDPVWVWTKSGVEKWHAVVITQDSVSGIPFETSFKCAICRRTIPRVQVDSMKHGYRTLAQDLSEGAEAIGLLLLVESVLCALSGGGHCD
jgi:hypothetical protein